MYTEKARSKRHLKQLIAMEMHLHGNQFKKEFQQLVQLVESFDLDPGPKAKYLYEQLKTSPTFQPLMVTPNTDVSFH